MLDPVARLLLLCARPRLGPEEIPAIRALLQDGVDVASAIAAARRNFMVNLLARHLLDIGKDLLSLDDAQALLSLRKTVAMRALELVRVQQRLTREVLRPAKVAHAFFKGTPLSHRYYGDSCLRQCRDIDLLVAPESMAATLDAMLDCGFSVTKPARLSRLELARACAFLRVIDLRAPSGLLVELHQSLDHYGVVVPARDFLRTRVTRNVDGAELDVLGDSELFVYLCYHHAKHRWSSLHWCADLIAFDQFPALDQARVLELATRLGLRETVKQAWRLRDDLQRLALGGEAATASGGSWFLDDCLAALDASCAGLVVPLPTPRDRDFPYAWQASKRHRIRKQLARMRPTAVDYFALPLAPRWQWLYYLTKPGRIASERWTRLWSPAR